MQKSKIMWIIFLCIVLGFTMYSLGRKSGSYKHQAQHINTTQNVAIQIVIDIADHLKSQTNSEDTIFVISRPVNARVPIMVKKLKGNDYPYSIILTEYDKMTASSKIMAPLDISVIVDKDGNASTQDALNLMGVYTKNPVGLISGPHQIIVDKKKN